MVRQQKPPTRIHRLSRGWRQASWSITSRCDLNCSYCRARSGQASGQGPTAAEVATALMSHGRRWVVGLTGGEPLMHPDLEQLCGELGRHFPLVMDSNLMNSERVRALARELAPTATELQVHATLHTDAVPWPEGAERFAENVATLRAQGVEVMTVAVLHPARTQRFIQARELLAARGIELLPKPFKGTHAGRDYPLAYDPETLALLLRARPFLRFYPFNSRGLPCAAGQRFVRIEPDGAVQRCVGDRTLLGNSRDGFALSPTPTPCAAARCPCFGLDLLVPRGLRQKARAKRQRWRHHSRRPVLSWGLLLGAAVSRRLGQ